jgi:hypothetical protein
MNETSEEHNISSSEYDTVVLGGGAIKSFSILGAMQYTYDNYLLNDEDNLCKLNKHMKETNAYNKWICA